MEGYRLLGLALFDHLVEQGLVLPDADWNEARRKRVEQEVVAGLDPRIEGFVALNLGKVLEWAGKFDEAYSAFKRAFEVLEPSPMIYDRLGRVTFLLERYDDTVRYLREAIERYPGVSKLRANLAQALAKQGKTQEAMEQYWAEIELDPDSAYAHTGLARLLEQQGDAAAALEHYDYVLLLHPDQQYALLRTAYLLVEQERYDDALTRVQRALELDPEQYRAHNALGLIMQKKGNSAQAIHHFSEALRLAPGNTTAVEGLEALEARQDKVSLTGEPVP
jgi:tetratricopeptide (TPR) repeat protein